MREILFRGKRIDNGEWVKGSFLLDGEAHRPLNKEHISFSKCYIVPETDYENIETIFSDGSYFLNTVGYHIIPETVGQFTGLVDMNGTKIFEGDIFQLEDDIIGLVTFNYGCFTLTEFGFRGTWTESGYDEYGGGWGVIECEPLNFWYVNKLEVVGNIHDNPELLEV